MNDLTTTKVPDKLGNGDTWSVTGAHGRIEFDAYAKHGRYYDADGECIDAFGTPLAARVAEYTQLGDDDAVFAVLADLYRTELAGQSCPNCAPGYDCERGVYTPASTR